MNTALVGSITAKYSMSGIRSMVMNIIDAGMACKKYEKKKKSFYRQWSKLIEFKGFFAQEFRVFPQQPA